MTCCIVLVSLIAAILLTPPGLFWKDANENSPVVSSVVKIVYNDSDEKNMQIKITTDEMNTAETDEEPVFQADYWIKIGKKQVSKDKTINIDEWDWEKAKFILERSSKPRNLIEIKMTIYVQTIKNVSKL